MTDFLKESIRDTVRNEIVAQVNQPRQTNESLLAMGAVTGGGQLAWNKIRESITKTRTDHVVGAFWQEVDPQDSINEAITDIQRRLKLVKTLDELDRMRNEVGKIHGMLDRLEQKAKTFDLTNIVGDIGRSKGNKLLRLRPEKEQRRLCKVISELSTAIRKSFDAKMDELENGLLG